MHVCKIVPTFGELKPYEAQLTSSEPPALFIPIQINEAHYTVMIKNLLLSQSYLRHKTNYKCAFFKVKEKLSLPR